LVPAAIQRGGCGNRREASMADRVLLVLILVAAAACNACAHGINFAVAFVTVSGTTVDVDLTITASDVGRAAGVQIINPLTGAVDPGRLLDAEARIAPYVAERTGILAGDSACAQAEPPTVTAESDTGVSVDMRFTCPTSGAVTYRSRAMVDFDPAARQAVMLR